MRLKRRGIVPVNEQAGHRLEQIGATFVTGYHAALAKTSPDVLAVDLNQLDLELRGFAYEGAAMGLYLLDRLSLPSGMRFEHFLAGPAAAHVYMAHVGVGWAMARLPWRISPALAKLDPLLRWLAIDGYAFHEAYFRAERVVERQEYPRHIAGYQRRAFDQGLGRGLWFVEGADVRRIAARITRFELHRQPDMWSGVGLACAYAGGVEEADIAFLRNISHTHLPCLAQGAAFAAKARQRAGNPTPHTEIAARVLCGCTADQAAIMTDECLKNLSTEGDVPSFERWRQRIQTALMKQMAKS